MELLTALLTKDDGKILIYIDFDVRKKKKDIRRKITNHRSALKDLLLFGLENHAKKQLHMDTSSCQAERSAHS